MGKALILVALFHTAAFVPVFSQTGLQEVDNSYKSIDAEMISIPDSMTRSVVSIAKYINARFKKDDAKARAVFFWLASNYKYDAESAYTSYLNGTDEELNDMLIARHGACLQYAMLFANICNKCGLPTYVIPGITKSNGKTDSAAHFWCATRLDSGWYLMDPTWGAGYTDNGVFHQSVDDKWFKVMPGEMIKTHYPFDPAFQFLHHPYSFLEFRYGKSLKSDTGVWYSFTDSITMVIRYGSLEQAKIQIRRLDKDAVQNPIVENFLLHKKSYVDGNEGTALYNAFAAYYSNLFKPAKPDLEIQAMLNKARLKFELSKSDLLQIKASQFGTRDNVDPIIKIIDHNLSLVDEKQKFLDKYFKTLKPFRIFLFL